MKSDFYNITYNNVIIATSYSMNSLTSLHIKLKQNTKLLKDLIRHKIVIDLPENDNEAKKLIDSIKDGTNIGIEIWCVYNKGIKRK